MRKIIYDLEAESLNLGLSRPWQVAYRIEENGKVIARKERWIDVPNLRVSEGAARVTGFTYDKWHERKLPMKQVIDEMHADFFDDPESTIVAHNGLGYDVYVHNNLYQEAGMTLDFKSMILRVRDTLAMARARYHQLTPPEPGTVDFLLFQYRMLGSHVKGMKVKLSDLCGEFNIPFDINKTHDALYDVDLTSLVDNKLLYALDLS